MRARTANLRRAKAALSQLSYSPSTRGKKLENLLLLPLAPQSLKIQWARVELNHRPYAYQAYALTN
jgi:hypothetical protein